MHEITEFDHTIDFNNTHLYHISIQVGLDGFSFCILDPEQKKYLGLKHYTFKDIILYDDLLKKLGEIFKSEEWLNKPYLSSRCIYLTNKHTFIPFSLFNEADLRPYLEFNIYLEEYEEIRFNKISRIASANVFAIPYEISSLILEHLPATVFYHQGTPFIEHALGEEKELNQHKAYVDFHRDFFDFLITFNQRLLVYNSFEYKNEIDFTYYVLNNLSQLEIDADDVKMFVSGAIREKEKYSGELSKYLEAIAYTRLNYQYSYSGAFKNLAYPTYINLYNLYHCE